jgi:hypothetical protein
VIGNGLAHEAIEVMRCLREGATESAIMPLDESLAIMEAMDAIRAEWSRRTDPAHVDGTFGLRTRVENA